MNYEEIPETCSILGSKKTHGEPRKAIVKIVLLHSPRNLQLMRWNFADKIQEINPELRKKPEEKITGHLLRTYQALRLMNQQGIFSRMSDPLTNNAGAYWKMVAAQCSAGDAEKIRLRFLKFLPSGFCMFVQELPGHPVGMPYPGGIASSH